MNSFDNSFKNIKEIFTYFRDTNHEFEKIYKIINH